MEIVSICISEGRVEDPKITGSMGDFSGFIVVMRSYGVDYEYQYFCPSG